MNGNKLPRHWKPLQEISPQQFEPVRREVLQSLMDHYGIDEATARKMLMDEHYKSRFFVNDLYQISVMPWGNEGMLSINIRRRDGACDIRDWRHFQQIKNETVGAEREAFELYPAESRKVDLANKWHLWVMPEGFKFPIGWKERDVQYEENRHVPGMRQRPL